MRYFIASVVDATEGNYVRNQICVEVADDWH